DSCQSFWSCDVRRSWSFILTLGMWVSFDGHPLSHAGWPRTGTTPQPWTPEPSASVRPTTSWPGTRGQSMGNWPSTVPESEWQTHFDLAVSNPQRAQLDRTLCLIGSG